MKLLSLLSDEQIAIPGIAACIATDPALSGRLIKRANAADLANYCESRTVLQAVAALGLDRTREVSVTIATAGYVSAAAKTATLRPCWHHTLACALIASELARYCGLRPAELYTSALLHDIGRLALLTAHPAKYEAVLSAADGGSEDLKEIERRQFGVDHVQAGEWLARQWDLPKTIVDVIVQVYQPASGALNEVSLVQVACRLADFLGFRVNGSSASPDLEEITAPLPEWAAARLRAQLPTLKAAVLKEIELSESRDDSQKKAASEDGGRAEEAAATISDPHVQVGDHASPRPSRLLTGAVATVLLVAAILAWWYLR